MPYREAPSSTARRRELRFRPASVYLAPVALVIATAFLALGAREGPHVASTVTCTSGDRCALTLSPTLHVYDGRPCAEADRDILTLTTPQRFLWHHVYLYDLQHPGRSVSIEEARRDMARCTTDHTQAFSVVFVADTRFERSLAVAALGLVLVLALVRLGRGRGLTVVVDEIDRKLRISEQGLTGAAVRHSFELKDVDGLAYVEEQGLRGPTSPTLVVVLREGEPVEVARGRSMMARARYKRAAAAAKPFIGTA
jgi:hypothetical protein